MQVLVSSEGQACSRQQPVGRLVRRDSLSHPEKQHPDSPMEPQTCLDRGAEQQELWAGLLSSCSYVSLSNLLELSGLPEEQLPGQPLGGVWGSVR